jgi:hypothetical protein
VGLEENPDHLEIFLVLRDLKERKAIVENLLKFLALLDQREIEAISSLALKVSVVLKGHPVLRVTWEKDMRDHKDQRVREGYEVSREILELLVLYPALLAHVDYEVEVVCRASHQKKSNPFLDAWTDWNIYGT